MTETRVPLKKMLEAKAPDINLQADDILFVPLSGARVAAGEGFNAAIAAASGIGDYFRASLGTRHPRRRLMRQFLCLRCSGKFNKLFERANVFLRGMTSGKGCAQRIPSHSVPGREPLPDSLAR